MCNKCESVYPLTREHFGQVKNKSGRIYWRKICRTCMRANTASYYQRNKGKVLQRKYKRIQQENESEGFYTEIDIDKIRDCLNDKCRYCGKTLNGGGEIEHLIPISRGGTNWPDNITISCHQCNKEKHGKTLSEYLFWRNERGLPVNE